MRLRLVGIGRLKNGPERTLFDRYWDRAQSSGRAIGFHLALDQIDESRARRPSDRIREEAAAVRRILGAGAPVVALDEGGEAMSSAAFARVLGAARDNGAGELAVVIGGPDGLDPDLLAAARSTVAFGAMTWPHQLVRVLAAEQVYRAMTILAGHPYHRS